MPNWTKEQLDAINLDGSNIIVSAGAGSGKTAVLTSRVIRKLKNGVDIDKLLVLTFTNEAALEMKDRIRTAISKEEDLKKQLDYLDQAYITTFDSYALSIVKKYHYLLGVDKNVSIVDSSIINVLKRKYLEKIFLDRYEKQDENFLKLISDFCNKDDKAIFNAILSLDNKLDLRYDKVSYLKNYVDNYFNDDYILNLFKEYEKLLLDKVKSIKDVLDEIKAKVDRDVYLKYYVCLEQIISSSNYLEIKNNCNIKLPVIKNTSCIDVEKESIKAILEELKNDCIFDNYEEIYNIYFSTSPYIEAIINIILDLNVKILEFKKSKNTFEFVDISKMAIDVVLNNSDVREQLKSFYNEIMVDEYQDTNDLQEMFISLISNNNVYMVGDVKQSIYRFRNANPKIFKDKYESYEKGEGGLKIDLVKNFRSREEVLDDINILFDKVMDSFIGGANYKESHRMVFGNNAYLDNGDNHLNNHLEIYNYDSEDKSYSKEEKEIFIIGHDIKNKVSSGYLVFDKETGLLRKVKYSDFCIILDRGKEFDRYRQIFEYLGITLNVYEDSKLTVENDILVLKNLIKLILFIKNNVSLKDKELLYCFVSVGRSFLIDYKDSEIYKIINNVELLKESSLYTKCVDIAKSMDNLTSAMLLDMIVEKFNYYEKLINAFNISKANVRIDYLKNIAFQLENLGYTVEMFLEYLEDMINDSDSDIKYKVNNHDLDSVKIMNIHKSKGLEFPICYFAGFHKDFNVSDIKDKFLYDKDYGIITPYYKEGIGSFINKRCYAYKFYLEEISERIRLFYVAVTRAREKMIIVTSFDTEEEDKSINEMVSDRNRLKYRSFLDIISSIKSDLEKFVVNINLDDIKMSKDYKLIKSVNYEDYIDKTDVVIDKYTNIIDSEVLEKEHFSKVNNNLITKDEKINMDKGIKLHEIFEREDFLNPSNDYVKRFLLHEEFKDINKGKIYKEYEFSYSDLNVVYNGIIDLLIVFSDRVMIVDYKMYHIEDDLYNKQLLGYKNYIAKKFNLPVDTYLYSILSDVLEKIS